MLDPTHVVTLRVTQHGKVQDIDILVINASCEMYLSDIKKVSVSKALFQFYQTHQLNLTIGDSLQIIGVRDYKKEEVTA